MSKRVIALGFTAVAALGLAACSPSSPTNGASTPVVTVTVAPGPQPGDQVLPSDIASRLSSAPSATTYHMTMDMTTGSSGTTIDVTMDVDVDATDASTPKLSGTMSMMGITMKVVEVGSQMWADMGTGWQVLPSSDSDIPQTNFDANYFTQAMGGAAGTYVGSEAKAGTTADHYTFSGGETDQLIINSMDLWIDSQNHVVGFSFDGLDAAQTADVTMDVTMTDYGESLSITPPM